MASSLHLSDKHAAKMMKKYKHGQKVKMTVSGRINSMESRDSLNEVFDSKGPQKKGKASTSHHVGIDVDECDEC